MRPRLPSPARRPCCGWARATPGATPPAACSRRGSWRRAPFCLGGVDCFPPPPGRALVGPAAGSGGSAPSVEPDLPVYRDLNSDGRDDLLDALRLRYQNSPDPNQSTEQRVAAAKATLEQATIYPFRLRAGDDASCLNLYQANRP